MCALVQGLPPGGALDRAERGAGAGWDDRTELLARIVDLVATGNYLQAVAWLRGPHKAPEPTPRPGQAITAAGKPRMSTPAEVMAALREYASDAD